MLKANDFQPVALEDRDSFARITSSFPRATATTPSHMVCWNDYAHYRYAYVEDCIILCSTIEGKTRYRMPIGPRNPIFFESCWRWQRRARKRCL